MKKAVTAFFLIFISALFIGTSLTLARQFAFYVREEGFERGLRHLEETFKDVEESYLENLTGRKIFIGINGLFNKATDSEAVPSIEKENSVYLLENGYAAFIVNDFEEFNADQKNSIEMTVKASQETDADLLFLVIPPKVCKPEDFELEGVRNHEYDIIDYRKDYFESRGFDVLDLHEELHTQGLDHYSLFFRTDHHWNADAGLWAGKEITGWLSEKGFGVDSSTFSKDNYDEIMIEDLFLGSQGKQVGPYYAGTDDFKYFVPKFKTDYLVTVPGEENEIRKGGFIGTLFYEKRLVKNYFDGFTYSSFLDGDFALTKIENSLNENGPKILMIKDSFTNVLSVYFAGECSELHLIDPRHYGESISEYIRENDFDAVIVSLSARMQNEIFEWEN